MWFIIVKVIKIEMKKTKVLKIIVINSNHQIGYNQSVQLQRDKHNSKWYISTETIYLFRWSIENIPCDESNIMKSIWIWHSSAQTCFLICSSKFILDDFAYHNIISKLCLLQTLLFTSNPLQCCDWFQKFILFSYAWIVFDSTYIFCSPMHENTGLSVYFIAAIQPNQQLQQ